MTQPIQAIITQYREAKHLSLRAFAAALVENIPGESLTYMAVKNWEDGKYAPQYSFLITLAIKCRDWRGDFALDCLAALKPSLYAPAGPIGRKVLQPE